MDRMRNVIGDVMATEPDRSAYIKSLGINKPEVPILRSQSNRMPLGELTVRSAVRATVLGFSATVLSDVPVTLSLDSR